MTDESPDLGIMPVNNGMDANEIGPSAVRRIEVGEVGAVGIRAAGSDKDSPDSGVQGEVVIEGVPEGGAGRVGGELIDGEMVCFRGPADKVFDVREGVRRQGVDGGDGGEPACCGGRVRVEACEEEDEEDEAVFAAVVGEGEFGELVAGEGVFDDGEGGAGLVLGCGEEGVWGVGFGEEGVHLVVAVGDYGWEGEAEGGCCGVFSG